MKGKRRRREEKEKGKEGKGGLKRAKTGGGKGRLGLRALSLSVPPPLFPLLPLPLPLPPALSASRGRRGGSSGQTRPYQSLPLSSSSRRASHLLSFSSSTSPFPSSSYALDDVSRLHGFLSHRSIPLLILQSNYSRHELFAIFLRFKSLCCLSPQAGPGGIDARTFQRGVVRLSVEDDRFVHRVFALVDTDQSNSIEWEEFLVAMAALEKGSAEIKAKFACQVYDLDGDGFIGRQDLTTMFQASSMLKAGRTRKEGEEAREEEEEEDEEEDGLSDAVIAMFVSKVFETFGCAERGLIAFEDVLRHIKSQQITCDVWDLFGRSMLHETQHNPNPHHKDKAKRHPRHPQQRSQQHLSKSHPLTTLHSKEEEETGESGRIQSAATASL